MVNPVEPFLGSSHIAVKSFRRHFEMMSKYVIRISGTDLSPS